MSGRDASYLQHIARAVRKIDSYLHDMSEERFNETSIAQDAVIRNLEIISEASRRLSAALKERYPNIPWVEIAAAGNVYRHEYESIQDDLVWSTATAGLESIRDLIRRETEG